MLSLLPPALLSPRLNVTAFCISAFKTALARQREEVGVAASPDSARGGSGWGGCRNAALGDVTRGWGMRSNPTAGVPRFAYGVTLLPSSSPARKRQGSCCGVSGLPANKTCPPGTWKEGGKGHGAAVS